MGDRRVLVIEDERFAREALEKLLLEEGYLVRSAPSGKVGVELNLEFLPDILVCDYYLPDLDGLNVLREVRQSIHPGAYFILVTAGLSGVDQERALRREADAYLSKPIDLEKFRRIIFACGPAGARNCSLDPVG